VLNVPVMGAVYGPADSKEQVVRKLLAVVGWGRSVSLIDFGCRGLCQIVAHTSVADFAFVRGRRPLSKSRASLLGSWGLGRGLAPNLNRMWQRRG